MPIRGSVLIFILDDDDMADHTLGILLNENGYLNYKSFTTPEAMLKEMNPDVRICIIDYRLDNALNGLDVIDMVKGTNPACYFIMISGMKSFEVIERFCNTVNRGRFLNKNDNDFSGKLISFLNEIIEDIKIMNLFYNQNEKIKNDFEKIKSIIKK
jgi:ActR/RegA family two-component response regulator